MFILFIILFLFPVAADPTARAAAACRTTGLPTLCNKIFVSFLSVTSTAVREVPCVQEVVTPIYIVTHYINCGNYFLATQ